MVLQIAGYHGTFRVWQDNPSQHSGQAGGMSEKSGLGREPPGQWTAN